MLGQVHADPCSGGVDGSQSSCYIFPHGTNSCSSQIAGRDVAAAIKCTECNQILLDYLSTSRRSRCDAPSHAFTPLPTPQPNTRHSLDPICAPSRPSTSPTSYKTISSTPSTSRKYRFAANGEHARHDGQAARA